MPLNSLTLLLLGAGLAPSFVVAQLTLGLSTSCQAAATSLIATPFAACIDIIGLAGIFSDGSSVVEPLDNWLHGACTRACSTGDLSTANSILQKGCTDDIAQGSAIATALDAVISNYTATKDLLCLEAKSNSTFCLTNTLRTIETSSSAASSNVTIYSDLLIALLSSGSTASTEADSGITLFIRMLNSVPTSLICTDCLHGLATNLIAFLGEDAAGVASSGAVAVCGAGFGDGKVPDSVQVTTAADTAASSSSSASRATASASPTGKSATSTSGGAPKVGKENSSVWWLALATALVLGGGAVLV